MNKYNWSYNQGSLESLLTLVLETYAERRLLDRRY